MYLIIREENGRREYVSDPNQTEQSYSQNLSLAKTYPSRNAAEYEKCGGERIVPLADEMAF